MSLPCKLVPGQYRGYEYGLFLVHFFAVLCKTTTWNDQILRWLKNGDHDSYEFLNFYFEFIAVSQIQFRDSFDSE